MREYILTEEDLDHVAEYSADWWKRNGEELIRCKDCKWYVVYGCPYLNATLEDDDYCSNAERKRK